MKLPKLKPSEWFPNDPVNLKAIARETFLGESSRLVSMLTLAIFISAFLLVLVKNAYHQEFIHVQKLRQEEENLHTLWMELLIEQGTWGSFDRISKVSGNDGMSAPAAASVRILQIHPDDHLLSQVKAADLNALTPKPVIVPFGK